MDARQLLSATVYSVAYSPCGKYIAVANNFGFISIFDFEKATKANSPKWKKAIFTFQAHKGPIHSLVSNNNYLISGGFGPIAAWKWNDILEKKPAICWTLNEPAHNTDGSFVSNDVNSLASDGKKLYCGRDDNIICIWDLSTKKCEKKLEGHFDYIHDVKIMPNSKSLASASEDGSVKVWDLRTSQATSSFEPHKVKELSRPEYGKWLSCVAVDENNQWMVCGGGPSLSLWHLRSQSQTAILDSAEFTPYTAIFHNDIILSGGNQNSIHHWYTNGEKKATIPCGVGTVFSLTFNPKEKSDSSPLIAAGTGHKMDVFCNLNYKSHMLYL